MNGATQNFFNINSSEAIGGINHLPLQSPCFFIVIAQALYNLVKLKNDIFAITHFDQNIYRSVTLIVPLQDISFCANLLICCHGNQKAKNQQII